MHWLIEINNHSARHSIGEDSVGIRRPVPLLLSPLRIFFGCMGIFSKPVPRRDAGKDAALLLLHAAAPRAAGSRQVLAGLASALVLFVGSTALSFLLLGHHFGPAWTDYLLHGPGLSQLGILRAGDHAGLHRLRRGVPDVRHPVRNPMIAPAGGVGSGKT